MGRIFSALALCAALLLSPQAASAQSGPIKFIIGTAPGGAIDPYARLVADPMAKALGQSIIIDYKPGANGNASAQYIADQPADGLLIWVGTQAFTEINPSAFAGQRWSIDDFTPFVRGVEAPLVFAVHPDLPARTFAEFLTWAQQNKGKLSYASYQPGTPSHFLGALLNEKFALDLGHVPYRGSAPATQDLLAGQISMMFDNIPGTLTQARSGKVRPLGVTSAKRTAVAPEIPAIAETLPGMDIISWTTLTGPANLPPNVIERLSELSKKALESEDLKAKYADLATTAWWSTPADALAYRDSEEARLAPIIKASGARVD